MRLFIGCKIIAAVEMSLPCAEDTLGRKLSPAKEDSFEGYLVKYPDGYMSWSPKETFEEEYREIDIKSQGLFLEQFGLEKKS